MRRWGRLFGTVLLTTVAAFACGNGGGDETTDSSDPMAPTSMPESVTSTPESVTSTSDSVTSTSKRVTSTSDSVTSTSKKTTTTKKKYSFGLPTGDVSPAEVEREVYRGLRTSCSAGQSELNEKWFRLQSPLTVLLFQSAVHACRDETRLAQQFFDRAGTYGWSGIDKIETVCKTYKAVRSVLEQIDPASVTCPGGDLPAWPDGGSEPRDDPRTDIDERTTTTTEATSSTTR